MTERSRPSDAERDEAIAAEKAAYAQQIAELRSINPDEEIEAARSSAYEALLAKSAPGIIVGELTDDDRMRVMAEFRDAIHNALARCLDPNSSPVGKSAQYIVDPLTSIRRLIVFEWYVNSQGKGSPDIITTREGLALIAQFGLADGVPKSPTDDARLRLITGTAVNKQRKTAWPKLQANLGNFESRHLGGPPV